jgi:hypothetical protein
VRLWQCCRHSAAPKRLNSACSHSAELSLCRTLTLPDSFYHTFILPPFYSAKTVLCNFAHSFVMFASSGEALWDNTELKHMAKLKISCNLYKDLWDTRVNSITAVFIIRTRYSMMALASCTETWICQGTHGEGDWSATELDVG